MHQASHKTLVNLKLASVNVGMGVHEVLCVLVWCASPRLPNVKPRLRANAESRNSVWRRATISKGCSVSIHKLEWDAPRDKLDMLPTKMLENRSLPVLSAKRKRLKIQQSQVDTAMHRPPSKWNYKGMNHQQLMKGQRMVTGSVWRRYVQLLDGDDVAMSSGDEGELDAELLANNGLDTPTDEDELQHAEPRELLNELSHHADVGQEQATLQQRISDHLGQTHHK